jgi:hypothetical protein
LPPPSPSNLLFYQLIRHTHQALHSLLDPTTLLPSLYQNVVQSLIALPISLVFHSLYLGMIIVSRKTRMPQEGCIIRSTPFT